MQAQSPQLKHSADVRILAPITKQKKLQKNMFDSRSQNLCLTRKNKKIKKIREEEEKKVKQMWTNKLVDNKNVQTTKSCA